MLAALLIPILSACGGGGGSVTAVPPPPLPPPPPIVAAPLSDANTGMFGGAVLQAISLARDLTELLRPGVPSSVPTGGSSSACPLGGSATVSVSDDRLTMIETYSNCVVQPAVTAVTLNGRRQVVWSGPARDAAFTATVTLIDFRAEVTGGPSEEIDGTVNYDGGVRDNNSASSDEFVFNLIITSSTEGTLRLQNAVLDVQNSLNFLNDLVGVSGASGRVAHDATGYVDLGFDVPRDLLTFSGAGTGLGTIGSEFSEHTVAFQADDQSPSTAFLQLDRQEIEEIEFFNSNNRFGPLRDSTFVSDLNNILALSQDELSFSLRSNFIDRDGDLLKLNLVPGDVLIAVRDVGVDTVPFDDPRVALTLNENDAGVMTVTSATDGIRVTYQFDVFAEDASGLVSNDALSISFAIYLDSDLDGQADSFDDDDDNDGVLDNNDDFPLDPLESSDADQDGIGDNADPDDDNDGALDVDDAYPFDSSCFAASDGDGSQCLLSTFAFNSTIFADRNGVAYIHYYHGFVADRFKVYRYDTNTGHFLDTIELDPGVVGRIGPDVPFSITYAEDHHALYVAYDNSGFTRINLDDPALTESLFKMKEATAMHIGRAWDFGSYVVVAEGSPGSEQRFSYDQAGTLIDTFDKPTVTGSIIYVGPQNDKYCDEGVALDMQTGTFFSFTDPMGINCRIVGEPVPLFDGGMALVGNDVIDLEGAPIGAIQVQGQQVGGWLFNYLGVFARSHDGVEIFEFDGTPVEIIGPVLPQSLGVWMKVRGTRNVAIIIERSNGFSIERYVPPPP